MIESKPVVVIFKRETYRCDVCNTGEMKSKKYGYGNNLGSFTYHECTNCSEEKALQGSFPRLVQEVIE